MINAVGLTDEEEKCSHEILEAIKILTLQVTSLKVQKSEKGFILMSNSDENNFYVEIEDLENYKNYLNELNKYRVEANFFASKESKTGEYIPFGVYLKDAKGKEAFFVNAEGDELTQSVVEEMHTKMNEYHTGKIKELAKKGLERALKKIDTFYEFKDSSYVIYATEELELYVNEQKSIIENMLERSKKLRFWDKFRYKSGKFLNASSKKFEREMMFLRANTDAYKVAYERQERLFSELGIPRKVGCDPETTRKIIEFVEAEFSELTSIVKFEDVGAHFPKTSSKKYMSGDHWSETSEAKYLETFDFNLGRAQYCYPKPNLMKEKMIEYYKNCILNKKGQELEDDLSRRFKGEYENIEALIEELRNVHRVIGSEKYSRRQVIKSIDRAKKGKGVREGKLEELDSAIRVYLRVIEQQEKLMEDMKKRFEDIDYDVEDFEEILAKNRLFQKAGEPEVKRIPISEWQNSSMYEVPLDILLSYTEKNAISSYKGEGHQRIGRYLNGTNENYLELACGEEALLNLREGDLENIKLFNNLYRKCLLKGKICLVRGCSANEVRDFGEQEETVKKGVIKSASTSRDVAERFARKTPRQKGTGQASCMLFFNLKPNSAAVKVDEALWGTPEWGGDEEEYIILPQNHTRCTEGAKEWHKYDYASSSQMSYFYTANLEVGLAPEIEMEINSEEEIAK